MRGDFKGVSVKLYAQWATGKTKVLFSGLNFKAKKREHKAPEVKGEWWVPFGNMLYLPNQG